ncbi:Uncharacterised protein [Burkholderia pseudomallei]|nr:Uncharacterised protein [Burkholderia pseudomallei]CAJ4121311.1 Uncharacterised protein [Burkholderia pseudomallei]CAJ6530439.1 Uncharacterised protein [Burkholderia pseudomallei]CAJ7821281.1 Uncharacterised protein [Burkholderia pseudomallei]
MRVAPPGASSTKLITSARTHSTACSGATAASAPAHGAPGAACPPSTGGQPASPIANCVSTGAPCTSRSADSQMS